MLKIKFETRKRSFLKNKSKHWLFLFSTGYIETENIDCFYSVQGIQRLKTLIVFIQYRVYRDWKHWLFLFNTGYTETENIVFIQYRVYRDWKHWLFLQRLKMCQYLYITFVVKIMTFVTSQWFIFGKNSFSL